MEKVVIDQESLKRFINEVSPGAYVSLTKIDFRALDLANIKPVGVYGSKERITDLLLGVGAIEPHLSVISSLRKMWFWRITYHPTVWIHSSQVGINLRHRALDLASISFNLHHPCTTSLSSTGLKKLLGMMMQFPP